MQDGPGKRNQYSDLLQAWRSGNQIPVGARFSAPIQTGPGAQLAFCTVRSGPFQGIKWSGHGVNHLPHIAPRLKKEYNYTSTPHLCVQGRL